MIVELQNTDIPNEIISLNYYTRPSQISKINSLFSLLNITKYSVILCTTADYYDHNSLISVVFKYNFLINYETRVSITGTHINYSTNYNANYNTNYNISPFNQTIEFYKKYPTSFKLIGDYIQITKPKEYINIVELLYSNDEDNFNMVYEMILTLYNFRKDAVLEETR